MLGHEYVDIDRDAREHGGYFFSAYFEFGGIGDSLTRPQTSINIDPTLISNSIPPERLLALWDAILNSTDLVH
jgi:hypothetical protein